MTRIRFSCTCIDIKLRHDEAELQQYQTIIDQYSFRKQAILETLHEQGINISKLDAVCARGGLLRPALI